MDNIMIILYNENNQEKIKKIEEIDILKEAASQNIQNPVINGRKDPLYKILLSVDSQISTRRQPKEGESILTRDQNR